MNYKYSVELQYKRLYYRPMITGFCFLASQSITKFAKKHNWFSCKKITCMCVPVLEWRVFNFSIYNYFFPYWSFFGGLWLTLRCFKTYLSWFFLIHAGSYVFMNYGLPSWNNARGSLELFDYLLHWNPSVSSHDQVKITGKLGRFALLTVNYTILSDNKIGKCAWLLSTWKLSNNGQAFKLWMNGKSTQFNFLVWKLCLSAEFLQQDIRWNYLIFCSESHFSQMFLFYIPNNKH